MGKLLEKLKNGKRDQWILLLLVGILMMILALPTEKSGETQAENVSLEKAGEEAEETQMRTVSEMEERLEETLGQMEGAGNVQVMITWKNSGEKTVEKDRPSSSEESGEEGGSQTLRQEQEETTVYIRDSDGNETPWVSVETAPEIAGVLVLAQGGDQPQIASDITDAVMALFGIEAHKIKVMKMK